MALTISIQSGTVEVSKPDTGEGFTLSQKSAHFDEMDDPELVDQINEAADRMGYDISVSDSDLP